jgi:phage gp29-like protein
MGEGKQMKLYDAYGREVDTGVLREEQGGATMSGVRNIFTQMHPSAGLTPGRLTEIMRAAEAGDPYLYLELAEEMEEKDLHYLAVLNTRKQAVSQLEISVRPCSTGGDDQRAAAMAREMIVEGPIQAQAAVFDILDAVGKGFSATEIVWDMSGREWYPADLKWRDPRWFGFDWISGEQLLVRTMDNPAGDSSEGKPARGVGEGHLAGRGNSSLTALPPMTAPLAPYKWITHFAKAKSGLPIRGGLARAAGWAYLFKNYVVKDWITFTEVFGQPLRLGKYNPGATEQDKQTLLKAVASIGTDAAAIVPESMVIEFTQANQNGSPELYQKFCEYLDSQVSKAVLGQTLTTEMPRSGGSRAAAQVHDAVRRDILSADARRLSATLARDLVRPIVDLNMGPQRRYPTIELTLPDDADTKVFAEIVALLADRGLQISQKEVLQRLGLSPAMPGDAVLSAAAGKIGASAGN